LKNTGNVPNIGELSLFTCHSGRLAPAVHNCWRARPDP